MNNDWKDLEKGNLPSDILVGDYEFQCYECGMSEPYHGTAEDIIDILDIVRAEYRKVNRKKVKRMPFGKFWNNKTEPVWGYLKRISDSYKMPYVIHDGACYQYFEEGLPEAYLEVEG